MTFRKKTLGVAFVAMVVAAGTAQADPHGGGGSGGWHHGGSDWHGRGYDRGGYDGAGRFWGGVGIGLGIGALAPYWNAPSYYDAVPYYGGNVVTQAPPIVYYESRPVPTEATTSAGPVPLAAAVPEPIVYPRNSQGARRTENDRRECNRWATAQQGAATDTSVFQRATAACLEGRGYTVR